jgi:hypothetical protein
MAMERERTGVENSKNKRSFKINSVFPSRY